MSATTNTTRSVRNITGSGVKELVGLKPEQLKVLEDDYGISKLQDLAMLDKSDVDDILGQEKSTFLVRRRLTLVCNYLRHGGSITSTTTMNDILSGATGTTTTTAPTITTKSTALIKLSPTDFPKFTGEIEDQEDFKTTAEAQIGQTAFKFLLTRDASNDEEKERDEELFNVFKNSFYGGKAYNVITQSLKDSSGNSLPSSGRRVWLNFLKWCNSGGRQNTLIKSIKDELKNLKLDGDTIDGLEYVNQFIILYDKLDHVSSTTTSDVDKMTMFVDHIEDPDFETVQQLLNNYLSEIDRGTRTINVKEFTDMVEARQRSLNKVAVDDQEVKSRRNYATKDGDSASSTKASTSELKTLLQIPSALYSSFNGEQKKAFVRWKNATIAGEKVSNDDIQKILNKQNSGSPSRGGKKRKKSQKRTRPRKSGALKVRSTVAQNSDVPSPEVQLKMKSDDESSSSNSNSDEDIDRKSGAHRVVRGSKQQDKNPEFPFHSIMDTGTEWTVVGGPAWAIRRRYKNSLNISAIAEDMTTVQMQYCDAVTAMQDDCGKVHLIGVRRSAYSPNLTDDEAVINDHMVREAGWQVDCVSERHGGSQCFWLPTGEAIPLEYDRRKYKMYFSCRAPSTQEMAAIPIHWIDCHIRDLKEEVSTKPVRRDQVGRPTLLINPDAQGEDEPSEQNTVDVAVQSADDGVKEKEESQHTTTPIAETTIPSEGATSTTENADDTKPKGDIDWGKTMGISDDTTLSQTLRNTTQFFPNHVEAENQAYPVQHRQKRLFALHGKRLQGRSCADTFFSSIKSIRKYTCVQLFVVLFADFLWVKLLRRESQVPGAYIDFCREVGVPNELLTDNSKVQAGKRFVEVDRKNQTTHIFSTPHCQNQNPSERRIQDVKHRAILMLYSSNAPLEFWCYAVKFTVDCLNHSAKRGLFWRTAKSVLTGNTVDISVFRFHFWQPIEFINPHAKFPACKWQSGRFVGIAWEHGDPFTYLIWTEPDQGGWKKGRELVRNVVRARTIEEGDTKAVTREEYDKLILKKNTNLLPPTTNTSRRKKRPRGEEVGDEPPPKRREAVVSFGDTTTLGAADDEGSKSPTNLDSPLDSSHLEEQEGESSETTTSHHEPVEEKEESLDDSLAGDDDSAASTQDVEQVDEINDQFFQPDEAPMEKESLVDITGYRWKEGRLQLRYLMSTEDTQWVEFRDARLDHPRKVAQYIVSSYKPRSKNEERDRALTWAKKTLRDLERAVRRIARLYDFYLDEDDRVRKVRRMVRAKKKKARGPRTTVYKYGVEVPRNVKHAIELDKANGNTMWQDAMAKEIAALNDMDCFEFRSRDNVPGGEYQLTTLHMVFDCKQDMRRKARLVAGGHLVELLDNDVYSSTVKGISVKLLHVIAHSAGLDVLCGDIGNAYVNAYTTEKVYARAGLEFGEERRGQIVVIKKALYGLATSCARFHDHLSDTLRSMGFLPTRFDRDVWIRKHKGGISYEYICTHVDDFSIFSKDPHEVMVQIQEIYTVKSVGPPEYYLGNDFKKDKKGRWMMGCRKYIREALSRVERIFGTLSKHNTPSVPGDHPELDDTPILHDEGHQQYQMLVGILNWIVILGRIDITHSVSSLARFVACPREGHKTRALYVFGYLKRKPNRRVRIDSRDPIVVKNGAEEQLEVDLSGKLKEQYPDAEEILDDKVPEALFGELAITAYVDSDHAHDKVTRRSITGLIIFVGRTPVFYQSKRQGAIETSTYGAEFMAMKTAVEEVMAVRYMLRCLGVPVTKPSRILGDNRSVIINAIVPASLLKKKHVAISYHMAREATAAHIVFPVKTSGRHNFSDVLTKPQTCKVFAELVGGFMC